MKTLFFTHLAPTRDQHGLYDWIVAKSGITPLDVLIVCKKGAASSWALAQFQGDEDAFQVMRACDAEIFNDPKRGVAVFLSYEELRPPTDPRWKGCWLNWRPKPADLIETPGVAWPPPLDVCYAS